MPAQRRFDENDPLVVERRRHAETSQELETTKRQLGDAHRRCIELHEKPERQLSAEAIDAVLDEAVERGRVWPDDRDEWKRKLEEDPSGAIVELAQEREYTREEIDAQTRQIAAMHKLDPSQVI